MKNGIIRPISRIERKPQAEGQSLEEHLRKMIAGKEPIDLGAQIQYTDRADGILPQFDIRTDRFTMAMEAMDKIHATNFAQRMAVDGFEKNDQGQWVKKPDMPDA